MTGRRIAYCLCLGAAILFQIFYNGYIARFLFLLTIILPFLSLLLSLPTILSVNLILSSPVNILTRGETGKWHIITQSRRGLPLAAMTLWIKTKNVLTNEERRFPMEISGVTSGTLLTVPVNTRNCGQLECRAEKVRAYDCLGLFTFKRRAPEPAFITVMPFSTGAYELPGMESKNIKVRARPAGPGDDYEIRDYRPGDPLRAVHWKLSSKQDELLVRETMEIEKAEMILIYDHFGTPERLNKVFDRLSAISTALTEEGQKHTICWTDQLSGAVRSFPIRHKNDLNRCLKAALAENAPLQGESITGFDQAPASGNCLYISAEEGEK